MIGFFAAARDRLRANCPARLQVESGMTRDAVEAMTLSHEVSALNHLVDHLAAVTSNSQRIH